MIFQFFRAITMMLSPQRMGRKTKPVMAWKPPSEPKNSFWIMFGTKRM
jgi:hypothetical protein